MSRWRETLCGSAIKEQDVTDQQMEVVSGDTSAVLSCGGTFLPQPSQSAFISPIPMPLLHLPKTHYEVLRFNGASQPDRFGSADHSGYNEFDVLDDALAYLEDKMQK